MVLRVRVPGRAAGDGRHRGQGSADRDGGEGLRALLLIGSPKGPHSTSAALGRYLVDRLAAKGWETEEMHLQKALRSPEGVGAMAAAANSADLVVLSFPTYLDSTPAAMVRAMELLAQARGKATRRTSLVAIANCGFPEASQNLTALEICRLFARDAGFEWRGGLPLGGGPAIDGTPLVQAGGVARHARRGLNLAADALAEGRDVPPEATKAISRPVIPPWLYVMMANRGWKKQAGSRGVADRTRDRPFMGEER